MTWAEILKAAFLVVAIAWLSWENDRSYRRGYEEGLRVGRKEGAVDLLDRMRPGVRK